MSDYGWGLFKKGLKRRGREVRRMRVMTCLAVFFLAFTLLFQDNINAFQLELNYKRHGKWAVETMNGAAPASASLYKEPVKVLVGSSIYRLYPTSGESDVVLDPTASAENPDEVEVKPVKDENGSYLPPEEAITVRDYGLERSTSNSIGVMPNDFALRNGIELYEGRLPEAPDEIAVELSVLQKLGLNYELGQTVEFYTAEPFIEPASEEWYEAAAEYDMHPPETFSYIKLHLSSFTLVGTVKRYTINWDGCYWSGLPNAFITQEAFDSLDMNKRELRFYEFKEALTEGDVWQTAAYVFDAVEANDDPYILCNRSTYSTPFWGSDTVYKAITLMLVLMSTAIIAYLMSVYLEKRRKYFIVMREIGASSSEVFAMSAYECVLSVLPSALITLLCSYAAALALSAILSRVLKLPFTFVLRPKTLRLTILAIAATLALALGAALAVLAGKGLREKKKDLSRSASSCFRKRAERKQGKDYLSLNETLLRRRRLHPLKTAALRLVSILLCCVVIFSVTKVVAYWQEYYKICARPDITAEEYLNNDGYVTCTVDAEPHWNRNRTKKVTTDHYNISFGGNFYSVDEVIPEEQIKKLDDIPGIAAVYANTYDCMHYLSWDGQEDDAFINRCAERAVRSPGFGGEIPITYGGPHQRSMELAASKAFYRLFCFGDTNEVWKRAKKHLDPDVADYEAFLRGEQIILVVDETGDSVILEKSYRPSQSGDDDETVSTEEPLITGENLLQKYPMSISSGSTVFVERLIEKIEHKKEKRDVPVTVAAVIPLSEFEIDTDSLSMPWEEAAILFSVIGSPELARRVMESDGLTYGANLVEVEISALGRKERSESEVVKVLAGGDVAYFANIEYEEENRTLALEKTLTYGPFALALITLWLFVMTSVAREERASLAPIVKKLKGLGESDESLKKQKSADSSRQSMWVLLAIPLYSVAIVAAYLIGKWKSYIPEEMAERAKEALRQNYLNWLHSRFFVRDLAYEGNYILQVTVLCALLFCFALFIINRRIDTAER